MIYISKTWKTNYLTTDRGGKRGGDIGWDREDISEGQIWKRGKRV